MTEPKRLLEGGGSELEQLLLSAGRAARPTRAARWRTETLVLLGGLGIAAKVKAASPLGHKAYAWTLARYLTIGAAGGATAWGAAQVATHVSERAAETVNVAPIAKPSVPRAPSEAIAPPRAEQTAVKEAPLVAEVPSELNAPRSASASSERNAGRGVRAAAGPASPRAVAATTSAAAPPVATTNVAAPVATSVTAPPSEPAAASSVGGEIQELDRARAALAAGQPRAAVSALDRYQQTFPRGALQQEALRLRIEAAVASGDRATARTLATRFGALYPNSPHAKRLHSLVNAP